jgi:hypothetical protein
VHLYYSTDQGQSWKPDSRTTPDQQVFPTFRAARDAEYWFAVRTLDNRGRFFPPDDASIEPNMKVVVDTTPPVLQMEPMERVGDRAAVRWEIRDENLDPKSLEIQYRAEGARDWRQVPIRKYALIGAEEWPAGTASALKVQARVSDLAGNKTEVNVDLPSGSLANAPPVDDGFGPPPPIEPIASASLAGPSGGNRMRGIAEPDGFAPTGPGSSIGPDWADSRPGIDPGFAAPSSSSGSSGSSSSSAAVQPLGPAEPPERPLLVPGPRFDMQYAIDDAGPEGPAVVELWITRDGGRTWSRQPPDPDRVSPYPVDLGGEGTYGLWLSVQSAASLGDPPPRSGDRPQQWVVVDSSPPLVRLDPPRIGTGRNLGKVLITWKASDPHLGPRPVLLSYRADRPDAPWTPLADRLDNTGQYIWDVPPDAPVRFHLRIDVIDSVGNRSSSETTPNGPILVDRSRPRGRILGLDPATSNGLGNTSRR